MKPISLECSDATIHTKPKTTSCMMGGNVTPNIDYNIVYIDNVRLNLMLQVLHSLYSSFSLGYSEETEDESDVETDNEMNSTNTGHPLNVQVGHSYQDVGHSTDATNPSSNIGTPVPDNSPSNPDIKVLSSGVCPSSQVVPIDSGKLFLRLLYGQDPIDSTMSVLFVEVIQAKLPALSDAVVTVQLWSSTAKTRRYKTSTIRNSSRPTWYETVAFSPVTSESLRNEYKLEVLVVDRKDYKTKIVGCLQLSAADQSSANMDGSRGTTKHWEEMLQKPGTRVGDWHQLRTSNQTALKANTSSMLSGSATKECVSSITQSSDSSSIVLSKQSVYSILHKAKSTYSRLPVHMLKIPAVLQAKHPTLGQMHVALWYSAGILSVSISKCRNLDLGGKSSRHYYIQVYILSNSKDSRQTSSIRSGTPNPEFNATADVSRN